MRPKNLGLVDQLTLSSNTAGNSNTLVLWLREVAAPLGQTLIVTFGRGWVQRDGGPVEEIHPGDVVWFEPGEKHWHGASATTAMTHLAINEALDDKAVDWMEKVSDEQYQHGLGARADATRAD